MKIEREEILGKVMEMIKLDKEEEEIEIENEKN